MDTDYLRYKLPEKSPNIPNVTLIPFVKSEPHQQDQSEGIKYHVWSKLSFTFEVDSGVVNVDADKSECNLSYCHYNNQCTSCDESVYLKVYPSVVELVCG